VDFWGTILVMFRRWYVVLPVLLLGVGGSGAIYAFIPTSYASTAVLMVAAPLNNGEVSKRAVGDRANPMLTYYGESLSTTAAMLVQSLSTPQIADEVEAMAGPDAKVQVVNGAGNSELLNTGPYLAIVADGTTPTASLRLVQTIVDRAHDQLAELQQTLKAPKSTFVTLAEVVPPTMPQPSGNGRARAAISALGLGMMISLASAYMAESVAVARRRRRPERVSHTPAVVDSPSVQNQRSLVSSGEGRRPGGVE
jgi:hypothetical protein